MNAYKLISLPLGADESRARFEVPIDSPGEVPRIGIDNEEEIVSDDMEEINNQLRHNDIYGKVVENLCYYNKCVSDLFVTI